MAAPLSFPRAYGLPSRADWSMDRLNRVRWSRVPRRVLGYGLVTFGAVIFLMPFFWMISTSLKPAAGVFAIPIQWWPDPPLWQNYIDAWKAAPFARYFLNSFIVSISATLLTVLVSGFAGYALAKLDFWGKKAVFLAILATIMLPGEVLLIPTYLVVKTLGMVNSYQALIIPTVGGALGVFLMRQTFSHLPDSLLDAARIDGASELRIYFQIVVPLFIPGLLTLALIEFRESWDSLLWPILVTNKEFMRTVPVGLNVFRGEEVTVFNQLMAMSFLDMLPLLLMFLFFQRAFIQGVAPSGSKD